MGAFPSIRALREAYAAGKVAPRAFLTECLQKVRADDHHAWISVITDEQLEEYLRGLESLDPSLPLWGVPFAVKDNIDLAGFPTTAACREFEYSPERSSFAVECLIKAGAVPLGKTNLDQFATGLVGVRSPYGECENSIKREFVSGGSSSGSAVSVALGEVQFAIGTDTAGSGRVPAAFNNIVGLKGTCGRVSTTGVVPACRSIDCVTVFACTADDLRTVFETMSEFDPADPFARKAPLPHGFGKSFVFAVPEESDLEFFGDAEAKRLFSEAAGVLEGIGGKRKTISLRPFLDAAKLLYERSFVAERYAGNREFFEKHLDDCLPVIKTIIGGSLKFSAADLFADRERLMELRRKAYGELEGCDCALIPTAGTIYKRSEVDSDPIRLNSNLGDYTNFMNLLDFCAIALPAGFRKGGEKDGMPFGITVFARAFSDEALLSLGARYLNARRMPTGAHLAAFEESTEEKLPEESLEIAVCGAHLEGLPLNWQLRECGAVLSERTRSAKGYRMFLLKGTGIQKPSMIRDEKSPCSFELEVYKLPSGNAGRFLAQIPYPLGLGKVRLEDGREVTGFICEGEAVKGCTDISEYGSFRKFMESQK